MSNKDRKAIIDIHREGHDLDHDGEALLLAAERSFFSFGQLIEPYCSFAERKGVNIPHSTKELFERLGIHAALTREEIVDCLRQHLDEGTEEFEDIVREDILVVRGKVAEMYENVLALSGNDFKEDEAKKMGRKRIEAVLRAAIDFCEKRNIIPED